MPSSLMLSLIILLRRIERAEYNGYAGATNKSIPNYAMFETEHQLVPGCDDSI